MSKKQRTYGDLIDIGREEALAEVLERMTDTIEHCSKVLPDMVEKKRMIEVLRRYADWLTKQLDNAT